MMTNTLYNREDPSANSSTNAGGTGTGGGTMTDYSNNNNGYNNDFDADESALDMSEQTNRPTDNALQQQRIEAWQPILDPVWVIIALFYLGVIMVPVGFKMAWLQDSVVEVSIKYDGFYVSDPVCGIGDNFNANITCDLVLTAPAFMKAPVLVYYQLENFHQNYRKYYKSFDQYQLHGQVGGQDAVSKENCDPLNQLGNMTLNPCGLIANTLFNDKIDLVSGRDSDGNPLNMSEDGIAWQSDIEFLYAQPDGYRQAECPEGQCDASCCDGDEWSCKEPHVTPQGDCYAYFYPDDETTQYLYETYPHIISPLEGVTNEHFAVWMKVATLPTFRKLYGWFNQSINEGESLVFRVNANYAVEPFRGSKTLLISTNNIFGGRNPYTGRYFIATGGFLLVAGFLFLLKHLIRPRRIGDEAYLYYKQD